MNNYFRKVAVKFWYNRIIREKKIALLLRTIFGKFQSGFLLNLVIRLGFGGGRAVWRKTGGFRSITFVFGSILIIICGNYPSFYECYVSDEKVYFPIMLALMSRVVCIIFEKIDFKLLLIVLHRLHVFLQLSKAQ